jgi:hypothetical protein
VTEHAGAQASLFTIIWGSWVWFFQSFDISPLANLALSGLGDETFFGSIMLSTGLFRFIIYLADYFNYKFHFRVFDYLSLTASVVIATIWFVIFFLFVVSSPRATTTPIYFLVVLVAITDVFESSGIVAMLRTYFGRHRSGD